MADSRAAGGVELVLGGVRSGKSGYAERRALGLVGIDRWVYVATGRAGDDEMAARIAHHRAHRDVRWQTVEESRGLAGVLAEYDDPRCCVLVDCLTLWLSHCLATDCWVDERRALLAGLGACRSRVLLVSNEVGSGIVPLGELSRRFADEAGRLHQDLARLSTRVTLVVAGLPLMLKEA
ncbi:bifunctional adenosylcobinamide kinase/adenosylcobinamide-phosphate guanylyltransferase [Salinisphaera sp. T31B1]|uniref:bifunctional adenosylcobinamide kinase/adenosylcobinamide-phosphate guanylyltransferase n=1 Tax=Salinisphaera sp. T31B1 TaxID=727963 RepID=UPI003341527C